MQNCVLHMNIFHANKSNDEFETARVNVARLASCKKLEHDLKR